MKLKTLSMNQITIIIPLLIGGMLMIALLGIINSTWQLIVFGVFSITIIILTVYIHFMPSEQFPKQDSEDVKK